jgi:hypothetical protein
VSLNRWATQRDGNERELVSICRRIGATVLLLNVKDGPDAAVGFRGKNFLFEFKLPPGPRGGTSHSKQSPGQVEFEREWKGTYHVICDADQMLEVLSGPSRIVSKGCR